MQILLPLRSPDGEDFPRTHYEGAERELIARFKGFTAYPRAPASGIWKSPDATVEKDDLIVYEVLTKVRDAAWWASFRQSLEKLFQQEKVLILSHDVAIT